MAHCTTSLKSFKREDFSVGNGTWIKLQIPKSKGGEVCFGQTTHAPS